MHRHSTARGGASSGNVPLTYTLSFRAGNGAQIRRWQKSHSFLVRPDAHSCALSDRVKGAARRSAMQRNCTLDPVAQRASMPWVGQTEGILDRSRLADDPLESGFDSPEEGCARAPACD